MATFFIEQFGCRATQADAAAIERQLLDRGYAASQDARSADVIVVNTCTVTASADLQARQAIHTMYRDNPATRIVVTGCYAQRAPEELAALKGVSWVVGNSHKPEIPRLIQEMSSSGLDVEPAAFVHIDSISARLPTGIPVHAKILTGNISEQRELLVAPILGGESGHTRPVLKIQDGCDHKCSYCVIPQVRGRSRSLAPNSAVQEIRKLVEASASEVVLSGIDLGSYGRDLQPRVSLGDLLRRVLDETSLRRLRVSSIEPMDVNADLIALFASNDRLAQHFHMPLQSGSDRVLAKMQRWYRAEHYARHAELVRELLPNAGIGADVIAGFPGETETDHCATLEFIGRLPLTYLHVFSYSPRPGTPAAGLENQIPAAVIARRANELRRVGDEKKTTFWQSQVGISMRVLTLQRTGTDAAGPWTKALSGNYVDVRVAGIWPANRFLEAKISAASDGILRGSV